jgi:hypothetical protein
MIYIFIGLFLIQTLLVIYMDRQNRQERERLQLSLMSKTTDEYIAAVERSPTQAPLIPNTPQEDAPKEEEDEYMDIDDVPMEKLLNADDKL